MKTWFLNLLQILLQLNHKPRRINLHPSSLSSAKKPLKAGLSSLYLIALRLLRIASRLSWNSLCSTLSGVPINSESWSLNIFTSSASKPAAEINSPIISTFGIRKRVYASIALMFGLTMLSISIYLGEFASILKLLSSFIYTFPWGVSLAIV